MKMVPGTVFTGARPSWRIALVGIVSALAALQPAAEGAATGRRPNIVVVFIDDMGWSDLTCFGNREAATPHIDRLAAEGIRFTEFYVNAPICSPSRVALTTGQYPHRWRITSFLADRSGNDRRGMAQWLDPAAPTLPRILHEAGYATGHFGKWHMGGQRDVADAPPINAYGFDHSLTNFEGMGPKLLPLTLRPGENSPGRIWAGAERLNQPKRPGTHQQYEQCDRQGDADRQGPHHFFRVALVVHEVEQRRPQTEEDAEHHEADKNPKEFHTRYYRRVPLRIAVGRRVFSPSWLMTVLTLVLLMLFISLGRWQWGRAELKSAQQRDFAAGALQQQRLGDRSTQELARYARLSVSGASSVDSCHDSARDFVQTAVGHVVHETANVILEPNERTEMQAPHALAHVFERITERLERPPRLDPAFGLDLALELVLVHPLQTAVGVVNQNDLLCAEQSLRQHE